MEPRRSPQLRISRHAVDRYRQRVAEVDPAEAVRRLNDLAQNSTHRPTPRHWTDVEPGPGVLFLYPHADSDVCLIVKNDTVVTVLSRVLCIRWRSTPDSGPPRPGRRQPYRRPSPNLWPLEAA